MSAAGMSNCRFQRRDRTPSEGPSEELFVLTQLGPHDQLTGAERRRIVAKRPAYRTADQGADWLQPLARRDIPVFYDQSDQLCGVLRVALSARGPE